MEKCFLCKTNPANKKGSHIVPHFLLKRIENVDGKTGRDYELGFIIKEFDTESHFGRSVPPHKLEETFGELTEEEIEKNKHPLVVDNFFCSVCENRLAQVENEYAKTLKKSDDKIYDSGISSEIGLLFWASILWRISINKKSGVELTKNQNETLRRILSRFLKDEVVNIDLKDIRASKDVNKMSYKLMRCPGFSTSSSTIMILHPKFKNPYSLIIDEFLLFFAFKDNYNDYLNKDFFGIQTEVLEAPKNSFNKNELIYPIDEKKLIGLKKAYLEEITKIRIKYLNKFWDKLHVLLGGKGNTMPAHIKQEILNELTSTEKKLGRKYNLEDLITTTSKVLKKYAP